MDHHILFNLALWDGVLAAVPGVFAALCYGRYRINRASYEATRAALVVRRAERKTAVEASDAAAAGAAPAPAE